MNQFLSGALAGAGAGVVLGWSLGVSGLVPNSGSPMWMITGFSIAVIFVGMAGMRKRS